MESKKNKKKDSFLSILRKKYNLLFHTKHHHEQNPISSGCEAEDEMIEHFLEARDMKAAEIMVPRADVVAVTIDSTLDVLKEKFVSTGFLRLLVYRKDLDDIVGFIHLKDVFAQICSNDKNFKIDNIITKTIYTARSTRCFSLFEKMKEEDVEVAVILDEYGGIEGVISIERLVEKMLGTMPNVLDEETQALPAVRMLSDNSCVVDARTSTQQLEEIFDDVEFLSEEEGEYETIGGFILSYLDKVPAKGEKFTHEGGLEVEIVDATSRAVKTVKVTRVKNLS